MSRDERSALKVDHVVIPRAVVLKARECDCADSVDHDEFLAVCAYGTRDYDINVELSVAVVMTAGDATKLAINLVEALLRRTPTVAVAICDQLNAAWRATGHEDEDEDT